jgi:hypothetical protein
MKQLYFMFAGIVLIISLSFACTGGFNNDLTSTTVIPSVVPTTYLTSEPDHTEAPEESNTPTSDTNFINNELTIVPITSRSLIEQGSIIYSYFGVSAPNGLMAVSGNNPSPIILIESFPSNSFAELSADGKWVARWQYEGDEKLVVVDLETNEERWFEWKEQWLEITGWTDDGKILILTYEEHLLGMARIREFDTLDPSTNSMLSIAEELELPGYWIGGGHVLNGYAAVDTANTRVLYTARGEQGVDVILRDVTKGEELWRYQGAGFGNIYTPGEWTADDSHVSFVVRDENAEYLKIYSLTRDGENLEELTPRPIQIPTNYLIRYIRWSSDEKYLHFSLWQTIEQGPGFILDMENHLIREISLPDSSFVEGEWLERDNYIIYTVRSHLTGEIELWILDVDNWSTQRLDSVECNQRFQILGWTSHLYQ